MKIRTVDHGCVFMNTPAVSQRRSKDRTGKLHVEINLAQFRPSGDDTVTFHCMIIQNADLRVNDPASPTALICRVVHIQYNLRIFAGGILIAVDTVSLSSGKLCINTFIFQHYLIIAGTGFLFVVRECGRSASAAGRHQCNVDQVRSSCPAQAGMAETEDRIPVIVVAGSVPPIGSFAGVRRKLYHTERRGRPRVIITRKSPIDGPRSNKRIYIFSDFPCLQRSESQ